MNLIKEKGLIKVMFTVCGLWLISVLNSGCGGIGTPTIDLDKYLSFDISGYDGYGNIYADIDFDAIIKDYPKLSLTSEAKKQYDDMMEDESAAELLEMFVDIDLKEYDGLSNGQSVTYKWDVNSTYEKVINCKLKYSNGSYTVKGLEEIGTFDAFDGITVEFSGVAPNGSASADYSGKDLSANDFLIDKSSGLSNGDMVTVSLKQSDASYYAAKLGMIPSEMSKTFEVSGLDRYIDAYSEIPANKLDKIRSEAKDMITAYAQRNYSSSSLLSDLEYAGYIFRSVKSEPEWGEKNNTLLIIYKGMVSNTNNEFEPSSVLFPAEFYDFLESDEGIYYETDNIISGKSDLGITSSGWGTYSTSGYKYPANCYQDEITAYLDTYDVEFGDGIEKYKENLPLEKLDDFSEAYLDELRAEGKDRVDSFLVNKVCTYGTKLDKEAEYVGEYLLTAKNQGTEYKENNKLILIYKAAITYKSWYSGVTYSNYEMYIPVEVDGIVKLPEDEYILYDISVAPLSGDSELDYVKNCRCFDSISRIHQKYVIGNNDKYKAEASAGLLEQ